MPGAEQMLAAVARGGPRRVDLLRVTLRLADGRTRRRVTASTLAVGWPVETVRLANRRLKLLGRFCYPVAAGLAAALARPFSSSLRVGRARARRLPMRGLLVNNTRHAGNFEAFPRAALADGRADGMIMTAGPVSQSLHNLSVLAGSDVWDPSARFRASAVDLRLDRPAGVQLDGELYGGVARLAIRVERGGWRLYAPAGCRL